MCSPSKSYEKFSDQSTRIVSSLDTFSHIETYLVNRDLTAIDEKLRNHLTKIRFDEITRTIIVLVVSTFDAYFTDIFSEKFIPYIKKYGINDDLLAYLEKAGADYKFCASQLFDKKDKPLRTVRNKIDKYFEKMVTQNFSTIDSLFKCYGIKKFSDNVQSKMRNKHAKSIILNIINRRHSIVHRSDLDSYDRLVSISLNDYMRKFTVLEKFVIESDKLISNKIP